MPAEFVEESATHCGNRNTLNTSKRVVGAGAVFLGLWLVCFSSVSFAAEPPTADAFAKLPAFENPQLSPNGDFIAVTRPISGIPLVSIQQIEPDENGHREKLGVLGLPEEYHFNGYQWANNDRLLLGLWTSVDVSGRFWNITRMWSADRSGKNTVFFKVKSNAYGMYRQYPGVISMLKGDDQHVLADIDDYYMGWNTPNVHKLNVYTGKKTRIITNKNEVNTWVADSNGVVRIGTRYDGRFGGHEFIIIYRETEDDSWERLQDSTDYFDKGRLTPVRFDESDPNILLMSSDGLTEQIDESHLFRYDLTKREVLGPYKNTLRRQVYSAVERALPDHDVSLISQDNKKQKFVFRVEKDILPPEYYLLDITKPSLDFMGGQYPQLAGVDLAPMHKVSYTARDGLKINGFLTLPVGVEGKNLPLVMYPHDGLWAHDEWGFDNYVQFMASRGFAVFQPQFRGSTGYGLAHEQAGHGELGMAVQDDITDGLAWLVEEGIVDPNRVCIVGSGFGGYAAAMGAAATPDLYQCAVSINGVLDLKRYKGSQNDLFYGNIHKSVSNDWEDLSETSPFHLADKIVAPMLIIGSEKDTVVSVQHSRKCIKGSNSLINKPLILSFRMAGIIGKIRNMRFKR